MPTPKTVLMTTDDDGDHHGEPERVDDVGVVEDRVEVAEAVGEGVLGDQRHRPGHEQEQVATVTMIAARSG